MDTLSIPKERPYGEKHEYGEFLRGPLIGGGMVATLVGALGMLSSMFDQFSRFPNLKEFAITFFAGIGAATFGVAWQAAVDYKNSHQKEDKKIKYGFGIASAVALTIAASISLSMFVPAKTNKEEQRQQKEPAAILQSSEQKNAVAPYVPRVKRDKISFPRPTAVFSMNNRVRQNDFKKPVLNMRM